MARVCSSVPVIDSPRSTTSRPGASGASKRSSSRSATWTISAIRHNTGSVRSWRRKIVSKEQSPPWWPRSAPRISNAVASGGTSAGSVTKTKTASGSRKRRISQAQAARSMCTPAGGGTLLRAPARCARRRGSPPSSAHLLDLVRGNGLHGAPGDLAASGGEEVSDLDAAQLPAPPDDGPALRCAVTAWQCLHGGDQLVVLAVARGGHPRHHRRPARGIGGAAEPHGRLAVVVDHLFGDPLQRLPGAGSGGQGDHAIGDLDDSEALELSRHR